LNAKTIEIQGTELLSPQKAQSRVALNFSKFPPPIERFPLRRTASHGHEVFDDMISQEHTAPLLRAPFILPTGAAAAACGERCWLAGVDVPVTNELVIVVEREEIPHLRLTHETFCFREDGCVLMPEGCIEAFAAFANAGAPMRMAHLAVVGHALAHANDHEIQHILTWAARTSGP
jgi:hypothetical protein